MVYNVLQIILNKFFWWLYNSNDSGIGKRETPSYMKVIKQLPQKDSTLLILFNTLNYYLKMDNEIIF